VGLRSGLDWCGKSPPTGIRSPDRPARKQSLYRLRYPAHGNRVLRRIFGSKRDKVTGEWRILHNEELNDLYCSPNISRVIKSRRMRWAGHVARMGERRGD